MSGKELFLKRMDQELNDNTHKGEWKEYKPTKEECLYKIYNKVAQLHMTVKTGANAAPLEYCADLANLCEKLYETLGGYKDRCSGCDFLKEHCTHTGTPADEFSHGCDQYKKSEINNIIYPQILEDEQGISYVFSNNAPREAKKDELVKMLDWQETYKLQNLLANVEISKKFKEDTKKIISSNCIDCTSYAEDEVEEKGCGLCASKIPQTIVDEDYVCGCFQVNLCSSCTYLFPTCTYKDVIFGTFNNDNVIICDGYKKQKEKA
ncbi:MAG: hypothetical protein GQ570_15100 [Helicobacteraceae bacterium]|nr:hypothetical protein [Helicobacteraceae bacterium]